MRDPRFASVISQRLIDPRTMQERKRGIAGRESALARFNHDFLEDIGELERHLVHVVLDHRRAGAALAIVYCVRDLDLFAADASRRSASHTLIMDCRVTPSFPASRSRDSIIHVGKSTFTRFCSRKTRLALDTSNAAVISAPSSNCLSRVLAFIECYLLSPRSADGTKSGPPSFVTFSTNSTTDFLAAPSFHDGSGPAPSGLVVSEVEPVEGSSAWAVAVVSATTHSNAMARSVVCV